MGEGYYYTVVGPYSYLNSTRLDVAIGYANEYKDEYPWDQIFIDVYSMVPGDKKLLYRLSTDEDIESFREERIKSKQWKGQVVHQDTTISKSIDEWEANQLNKWTEEQKKPAPNLVDTNLKTAAAQGKPKLSDVPPVALFALGAAMSDGATKYGRFNWRDTGSTASIFYDAMMRHLVEWYNGEDYAHDSKVHHLAHLMASCAILLDSSTHGILNDDRRPSDAKVSRSPELWKDTTK